MAELLEHLVRDRADEVALVDETATSTWAELDRSVDRWIAVLRGAGLDVGDRVAFVLGNRRETFEALLACVHAGLVAVPVNWHLTAPEIAHIVADSGARAVLTEAAYAPTVRAAVDLVPEAPDLLVTVDGGEGFALAADLPAGPPVPAVSGGVLLYTSGTSGRPKGWSTRCWWSAPRWSGWPAPPRPSVTGWASPPVAGPCWSAPGTTRRSCSSPSSRCCAAAPW